MKPKQTKIDRSAAMLLPGAMALAATAASSQAATVQITLTGNKISTTGGNQLVADLTGDGVDDLQFALTKANTNGAGFRVNDDTGAGFGWALAGYSSDESFTFADAKFEPNSHIRVGIGRGENSGDSPQSAYYLNPVTFTDTRINEGAPTNGYLQVNAFNTSKTNHTVELSRLVFDDASTTRPAFTEIPGTQTEWSAVSAVPEASTSLGLLALGAGGLLTRRRLKRAA